MNSSIRVGAIGSLLLTLILLLNFSWVQVFHEDEYAGHPENRRNNFEAKKVDRGSIFSGETILAESHPDENGNFHRSYPNMPVSFAPLTGYMSDIYGTAGLEAGFNTELSGESSLASSRFFRTSKETRVGNSVELTIDPQLQATAYDQLSNSGYNGAVVAIRPSSGEVLAMASNPSYDPNAISSADDEVAKKAWEATTNDPGKPLVNVAAQDQLPPGSIFKIITTAAALDNGYRAESPVTGAPSITLPGTNQQLTNYDGQGCGGQTTTLRNAFVNSCNTAFVEIEEKIGSEELEKAATKFGVGEKYDLGINSSAGSLGDLQDPARAAMSAIGQADVTMTALQAAVMAATVANEGTRMSPYIVKRVVTPDLKTLRQTRPNEAAKALKPEVAKAVTDLMYGSESQTWGYDGNGFASKTGTAEHGEGLPPHVWYVAFDPDKDVAVAVVVKNGGGLGLKATGGQVCSPIGRTILRAAPAAEKGGDGEHR
ncbi:penicillin-binding transpeptidase domain-containing protein [Corynebacterium aquatimens]|uniref:Cell division protein FtsI/penicillin-binding protein 2 n=1 Tax=Corynebacterium aquatimens TaxID=1190508 RepID=A0A931E0V2_9CORY|nr:penicillin-binding protein 2 [Corynebacterium aquatimens]MBG6122644.1 cell division protein FtsI/penicillin-binding protein 2 [Corynebacterium aquatimens]WJY64818.1 Penicillin-binding protein A [Corynebacterium aquatimens]